MARSCAFRIGPRRFELVVLDGSVKKHRIAAYYSGEFDLGDGADAVAAKAAALKDAARTHRIPKDNVSVVMDAGPAAFRRITLPFTERSKIEQVLKFEVESELPQFNIDDVIVDHHTLHQRESGAELLVTAVPKSAVAHVIAVCEKAGIEPLEVELETSAIVNAAMSADLCHLDDAQLLVHIGEHATSVVVMDGGETREMRVIHIGAMTHDPAAPAPAAEGEVVPDDAEADPLEAARRVDQAIKRIRRELGRTISGARTINPITAVYVSGMELPGLVGGTILDVPVYILDCFEEDSGQPADGYGQLVAAYGGAYRQLGGGAIKASLRREELRFTGAWERLEFPIAIVALLAATFLGMITILQHREIRNATYGGSLLWLKSSNNYAIGNPRENSAGRMQPPIPDLRKRAKEYDEVDDAGLGELRDPIEELKEIERTIRDEVLALKKNVGDIQEVTPPPSAFVGMTLVLSVLYEHDAEWRVALRAVKSDVEGGRGGREETVKVSLDMTFFSSDMVGGTRDYAAFKRALQEKPWFLGMEEKQTRSIEQAEGGGGMATDGFQVRVDVNKYFDTRT